MLRNGQASVSALLYVEWQLDFKMENGVPVLPDLGESILRFTLYRLQAVFLNPSTVIP